MSSVGRRTASGLFDARETGADATQATRPTDAVRDWRLTDFL